MRPSAGVVFATALAAALVPALARASFASLPVERIDLSRQLMLQWFGEVSDSGRSLAAAFGNTSDESFLRDLVFRVERPRTAGASAAVLPSFTVAGQASQTQPPAVPVPDAAFAPSALGASPANAALPALSPSVPVISLARSRTHRLPFGIVAPRVNVQSRLDDETLTAPQLSMNDNRYRAGANFAIRAGSRSLNVNVSSGYERLMRNDTTSFLTPPAASWQLPGNGQPFVIPSYADMGRMWVGAALAVPVRTGLTLNVNYGEQHLFGEYGLPGLGNLDAVGNLYGGGLTLAIPHSSGTLSISAIQERYANGLLPVGSTTQTNADVNVTVKF